MVSAIWKDTTIATSDETVIVEGNHYFPPSGVDLSLLECGFHTIRPPSPRSSGQAFHGHLATCSTAIRPGSRSAATQGLHC
ncbi:DUF427 domain-containing protein [Pseudomonas sp. FeN3W]|nr:DUF427 domain-containing protein [Pseudomonas sp. FeN3W]